MIESQLTLSSCEYIQIDMNPSGDLHAHSFWLKGPQRDVDKVLENQNHVHYHKQLEANCSRFLKVKFTFDSQQGANGKHNFALITRKAKTTITAKCKEGKGLMFSGGSWEEFLAAHELKEDMHIVLKWIDFPIIGVYIFDKDCEEVLFDSDDTNSDALEPGGLD